MISRIKRYFLEVKNFSNPIELKLPENFKIILDDNKVFYRLLVGQFENKEKASEFCSKIKVANKCLIRLIKQ